MVEYVGTHKPRLRRTRPSFFRYSHPIESIEPTWVESEACNDVRNAVDALMARMGPAESMYYLVDWLSSFGPEPSFGQRAIEVGDMEALEVLAMALVEMGTTEATFAGAVNLTRTFLLS